jgi:UDP-N-acetylmuramate-alanine ligase
MEIYPSARETSGPVNGKDLANETLKHHQDVSYLTDEKEAKEFIAKHSIGGNVIVLMGAGNVNDLVIK